MAYTEDMRKEGFLRNFIFGVEDSLVSTVGFVSGIAAASVERNTLLLSGVVLVFVEAFSMGIGSTLSEESVQEARTRRSARWGVSVAGGFVMFVSYILTGLFVLSPYLVSDVSHALLQSIALSLGLLFLLGVVSAKITGLPILRRAFRMMIVGGLAILLGIIVGHLML